MKPIFLAAGHSLTDPGACAHGYQEAALMLDLRDRTAAMLRAAGCTVHTDGEGQEARSLGETIMLARKVDGPRVELHLNSAADPSANGTEAIVARGNRPVAALAASLAAAVAEALGTRLRGKLGLVYMEDLGRLLGFCRTAQGVILEVCFISREQELLKYLANRDAVAQAIADALRRVSA